MDKSSLSMLSQIEDMLISLIYTGISTSSETTTQRLTTIINECSRNGFFRLAASMRFANTEFSRAMKGSAEVDYERYSFYLNQSWILTKGLQRAITEDDESLFENYSGKKVNPKLMSKVEVFPIGIEKGIIDNQLILFKIHFFILSSPKKDSLKQKIVTWTQMFPIKSLKKGYIGQITSSMNFQPETFLGTSVKGLPVQIIDFIQPIRKISLTNWRYSKVMNSLSISTDSGVKFSDKEINRLPNLPVFRRQTLSDLLESWIISPLDHEFTFTHYAGFPNILMQNIKFGKNGITGNFEYENLPINLIIPKKNSYRVAIQKFRDKFINKSKKKVLPFIYGIIRLKDGALTFLPISSIEPSNDQTKIEFLHIDMNIVHRQYQTKKVLENDSKHSLSLLGDLLGKK